MRINFTPNTDGIASATGRILDEYRQAAMRAVNKTATTARAQAAREIQSTGYGLKSSTVKDRLKLQRATLANLTALITASSKPVALIDYGARQTSKGVTVNVLHGRKLILHAFIATTDSGHRGVFIRTGKEHKIVRKNGKRYTSGMPIKELFGPGVGSALSNQAVTDALKRVIKERFAIVLKQELRFARLK